MMALMVAALVAIAAILLLMCFILLHVGKSIHLLTENALSLSRQQTHAQEAIVKILETLVKR